MKEIAYSAKTKLKSTSGVSVLVAMVLFLVAAMVSAVVISAAYTAFKSVFHDIENEQDYLAVSSAARLIGESLADTECTITEKETRVAGESTDLETTYVCTGTLGAYMTSFMDNQLSSQHELTVSLDSLSGDAKKALSPTPCKFKFRITPVNIEKPENNYMITGYVMSDSFEQKVWITAYAVPVGDDPETHEDTDQSNHDIKYYTTVTKIKWSDVRLDAAGGTND